MINPSIKLLITSDSRTHYYGGGVKGGRGGKKGDGPTTLTLNVICKCNLEAVVVDGEQQRKLFHNW